MAKLYIYYNFFLTGKYKFAKNTFKALNKKIISLLLYLLLFLLLLFFKAY